MLSKNITNTNTNLNTNLNLKQLKKKSIKKSVQFEPATMHVCSLIRWVSEIFIVVIDQPTQFSRQAKSFIDRLYLELLR